MRMWECETSDGFINPLSGLWEPGSDQASVTSSEYRLPSWYLALNIDCQVGIVPAKYRQNFLSLSPKWVCIMFVKFLYGYFRCKNTCSCIQTPGLAAGDGAGDCVTNCLSQHLALRPSTPSATCYSRLISSNFKYDHNKRGCQGWKWVIRTHGAS